MKKENKKKILVVTACILAVFLCLCGIFYPNSEINNILGEYQNRVIEEIKTIDENIIIEDITENENSSNENTIENVSIEEEQELETEEVTEVESFELQSDNIAYEGNGDKFGLTVSGSPQLTYISQIDYRWKDYIYSSTRKQKSNYW